MVVERVGLILRLLLGYSINIVSFWRFWEP